MFLLSRILFDCPRPVRYYYSILSENKNTQYYIRSNIIANEIKYFICDALFPMSIIWRCWWSSRRTLRAFETSTVFFLVMHVVKNLLELTNGETNEIAESDPDEYRQ